MKMFFIHLQSIKICLPIIFQKKIYLTAYNEHTGIKKSQKILCYSKGS
jgi:hypothetical protein